MPASKKRKPKPKAQQGAPALTAAIVPTRRQREAYAESTPADVSRVDLDAANALIAGRGFGAKSNELIALAYRALARSPLCVDAYLALAEETRGLDQSLDYLRRGINAGELALRGLDPADERFWTHSEGRPYLDARLRLAEFLIDTQEAEAIEGLRALLAYDPADRVGARYLLLQALLNQDDVQPARALLDAYAEERTTTWLYSRLLVGYREEQRAGPAVEALMAEAIAANPYVPGVFAEVVDGGLEAESEPGSPGEAFGYDGDFGGRWDDEPGAVAWLIALAGSVRAGDQ